MSRIFATLLAMLLCVPCFGTLIQYDSGISADLATLKAAWEATPSNLWQPWSLTTYDYNGDGLPGISFQGHSGSGGEVWETSLVGGLPVSTRVTDSIFPGFTGFSAAKKLSHVMRSVIHDLYGPSGFPDGIEDVLGTNGAIQSTNNVAMSAGGIGTVKSSRITGGYGIEFADFNADGRTDVRSYRPDPLGTRQYTQLMLSTNQLGSATSFVLPHPAGIQASLDARITAFENGNGNNQTKMYYTLPNGDLVYSIFCDRFSGGPPGGPGLIDQEYLLNVSGSYVEAVGLPDNSYPLVVADFANGDGLGLVDIISIYGPNAGVHVQTSPGVFSYVANTALDAWLRSPKAEYVPQSYGENFDCDAAIEYMLSESKNGGLDGTVIINPTDDFGHFDIDQTIASIGGLATTTVGDFNGDGMMDVAALEVGNVINMYLAQACGEGGVGGGTPEPSAAAIALLAYLCLSGLRIRIL